MSFTGTLQKCSACDKTVYVVDLLSADGVAYHKSCFKCSHCKGTLSMSNYSSMDGVLYCKPHFEQLFKETGSFTKNFQPSGSKPNDLSRAPSKLSSMFCGTQDKCATCHKTAYPLEKVSVEGESYHKSCFRCSHGGCNLTPSSYAALDGILYCKPHFAQLFKERGSYNHLLKTASMKRSIAPPNEAAASPKGEEENEDKEEANTEETGKENAGQENAKEMEQAS
ncbi:LIM domain-containing protein WLIM2a [Asimina triloba]